MSSTSNKPVKFIGIFTMVAGLLMIIAGGVTWGLVSTQLKAENITVAAITDENPGALAGKEVAGPFTAYAQANAINEHALEGAAGKTYAEIGKEATALKAKLAAAGASDAEIADNAEVKAIAATRTTAMNGSFLRASLFTSVVSFGVAALVIGLGVVFLLLGFALMKLATITTTTVTTVNTPAHATA